MSNETTDIMNLIRKFMSKETGASDEYSDMHADSTRILAAMKEVYENCKGDHGDSFIAVFKATEIALAHVIVQMVKEDCIDRVVMSFSSSVLNQCEYMLAKKKEE